VGSHRCRRRSNDPGSAERHQMPVRKEPLIEIKKRQPHELTPES
jgi:hypothetical protein